MATIYALISTLFCGEIRSRIATHFGHIAVRRILPILDVDFDDGHHASHHAAVLGAVKVSSLRSDAAPRRFGP